MPMLETMTDISNLEHYVVLYYGATAQPPGPPFAFCCQATDGDHAEEQCDNANHGCDVVWVVAAAKTADAYADYWRAGN